MWPGISRGLEPNPIQLCFTVIIFPRDTQCNIVKSAPQNAGHATVTLAAATMGVSELKRQVRVRTYYFVLIWYNIKLTLLFIVKFWRLAESMHTCIYRQPYRNLGNDEAMCRMLDITSQTKWFYKEKLRMQKWAVFQMISKHSSNINFLCIFFMNY